MIREKRVLHVVMEDIEVYEFARLLNRGLNTANPPEWKGWLELEARIDQFIRSTE
jgi:hypothetical protein